MLLSSTILNLNGSRKRLANLYRKRPYSGKNIAGFLVSERSYGSLTLGDLYRGVVELRIKGLPSQEGLVKLHLKHLE